MQTASSQLIQICYVDHSSHQFAVPHIHLQLLFADRSTTHWINCPGGNVQALRAALCNLRISLSVRLHAHDVSSGEDAPPNVVKAEEAVVTALPRLVLTAASAAHLAIDSDGTERPCPFCLETFAEGDEVLFMPCAACHVGHTSCTERWLGVSSTCPTCRFALPRGLSDDELATLIAPASLELARIRDGTPPLLCQPVVDDDDELPSSAPLSAGSEGAAAAAASSSEAAVAERMDTAPTQADESSPTRRKRPVPPSLPSPSPSVAPAPPVYARAASPTSGRASHQPLRRSSRMRRAALNRLAQRLFGRAQ